MKIQQIGHSSTQNPIWCEQKHMRKTGSARVVHGPHRAPTGNAWRARAVHRAPTGVLGAQVARLTYPRAC